MAGRVRLFLAYKITCLRDGRAYVGITTTSLDQRFREHQYEKRTRSRISRAIRRYGRDAFSIECLYEASSWAELVVVERALIAQHGTYHPRGFNLTIGGEGRLGARQPRSAVLVTSAKNLGKKRPAEAIRITAEKHRGMKRSPETRALLSELAKKRAPMSAETRAKLSAQRKGRRQRPEVVAKIAAALRGRRGMRRHSEETRQKIGASLRAFHATRAS